MSSTGTVKCQLCSCLSPNLTLYVSHLRLVHSKDQSFRVVCGIGTCMEVFTAFAAYSSHIYRHHRAALGLVESVSTVTEVSSSIIVLTTSETGMTENGAPDNASTVTGVEDDSIALPSETRSTRAAKYLLKLREGYKVSEVALIDIIGTCKEMCMEVDSDLKLAITERLTQANIGTDIIEDILNEPVPHPFEGVDTIFLFEKFCVDHLNCLVGYLLS